MEQFIPTRERQALAAKATYYPSRGILDLSKTATDVLFGPGGAGRIMFCVDPEAGRWSVQRTSSEARGTFAVSSQGHVWAKPFVTQALESAGGVAIGDSVTAWTAVEEKDGEVVFAFAPDQAREGGSDD